MTGSPLLRSSLPEYAHPPIVSATLGVVFRAPREATALTAFQERLGPEWAGTWLETTPQDDFGEMTGGLQLKNVLGDRVVRVGANHFAFTWLGTTDARYPRYENLRDGFVAAWDAWSTEQQASAADVRQWQVSYLNQISQGTVWQTPGDWTFFRLLPSSEGLAERVTSAHWVLKTPELADGLAVDWKYAPRRDEAALPSVWIRLTASGAANGDASELLDGMDAGRAAIVLSFSELMSPSANAYWGLRRRER
jgi:hypothetical protein